MTPLPRHKYNHLDASYELARCIGQFIDDAPTILKDRTINDATLKDWTINDRGVPGHHLCFKDQPKFVILPKFVAGISMVGAKLSSNSIAYGIDTHQLSASSPDFFTQLLNRMNDIAMKDGASTIWRPE